MTFCCIPEILMLKFALKLHVNPQHCIVIVLTVVHCIHTLCIVFKLIYNGHTFIKISIYASTRALRRWGYLVTCIDTAKQHKRRDTSQDFGAKMGCGASSVGAVDHVAGNVEASRGQATSSHKGRLHKLIFKFQWTSCSGDCNPVRAESLDCMIQSVGLMHCTVLNKFI